MTTIPNKPEMDTFQLLIAPDSFPCSTVLLVSNKYI